MGGNSLDCIANLAHIVHPNDARPIEALGGFSEAIVPFAVGTHLSDPARAGTSELVAVNCVAPALDTVRSGAFPFSRDVYNVYRQSGVAPVASAATVGFVGENGWICKPQALHSEPPGTPGGVVEDPLAVRDYGQLVVDTMLAAGFIPKAASGKPLDLHIGDRYLIRARPPRALLADPHFMRYVWMHGEGNEHGDTLARPSGPGRRAPRPRRG